MIEYGITTSKAEIWFHVCPNDVAAYWYARSRMVELLPRLPERKIVSAAGRLCRLFGNRTCDGGFIHAIELPLPWVAGWQSLSSDAAAGELAERVFEQCVEKRLFQIPARAARLNTRAEQLTGRDYVVRPVREQLAVEVKADFVGGEWGSGNLFIQTHELHHQPSRRNAHREVA